MKSRKLSLISLLASLMIIALFNIIWLKTAGLAMNILLNPAVWCWTLCLAIVLSIPTVLWSRGFWISLALQILLVVFFISNLVYCEYFNAQIPFGAYRMICNLNGFTDSIVDGLHATYLIFPIVIFASVIWYLYYKNTVMLCWQWISLMGVSVAGIIFSFNYPESFAIQYNRYMRTHGRTAAVTVVYSPFANLIYQMTHCDSSISRDEVADFIQDNKIQLQDLSDGKEYTSLVIILLESFDSFVLDLSLEDVDIAPNLSGVAHDKGTLFVRNVMPEVGVSRSMDAQLLINSGLIPPSHESFCFAYPGNYYPSIAKIMARYRCATRSINITSDQPSTYNQGVISPSFGYKTLVTYNDFRHDFNSLWYRDDSIFFRKSAKMLSDSLWPVGSNAVVQLVSYSCHTPFRMPPHVERIVFDGIDERLSKYLNVVRRTDAAVGEFLKYLSQRSDFDSMQIVITGDHNVFSESSYRKLGIDKLAGHKHIKPMAIPLIVINSPVCREIMDVVPQSSIYPTMLELLGLTDDVWPGIGKSVFRTDSLSYKKNEISDWIIRHDYIRSSR